MQTTIIEILLSLLSFIGITIIYFLKMSFAKLELMQLQINELKIDIAKIKK